MKTLREIFYEKTGESEPKFNNVGDEAFYYKWYAEWIEKGVEKQYAIRDKLIKELMSENKELKKEIKHVKDVWIGISDAKDLIIKRMEKEIVGLKATRQLSRQVGDKTKNQKS
jgi:hypothetical protein